MGDTHQFEAHIREFVDALSATGPVPAAGAAAAAVIAQGAALGVLAIRVSKGRSHKRHLANFEKAESQLSGIAAKATAKISEDCNAVREVMALARQRNADEGSMARATGEAHARALEVPLDILALAAVALTALQSVSGLIAEELICELAGGAALVHAGAQTASLIVRHNAARVSRVDVRRAALVREGRYSMESNRAFTEVWDRYRGAPDNEAES